MQMIKLTSLNWPTPVYINVNRIDAIFAVITDGEMIGTDIRLESSNLIRGVFVEETESGYEAKIDYANSGTSLFVEESLEEVVFLMQQAGVQVYENMNGGRLQ